MPTKEHTVALDDHALNWIRLRITTVGGQVTAFLVQFETTIAGERYPVVRYDASHGFAHRDRLNRRGVQFEKYPLPSELSLEQGLTLGEQDIRNNWRRYRDAFLRDEP
jgi:hypothetical protein